MHAVETGHGDNCSGMVERAVLQPYPARQNRRRGGGLWENSAQSSARWGSRGVMKRAVPFWDAEMQLVESGSAQPRVREKARGALDNAKRQRAM